MGIVIKIIIAIVGFIVIKVFLTPLLLAASFAPFGVIIIVLLYIAILAWLFGYIPNRNTIV